jgi:5-methylcytosine-specific restriction endonuclease McrA
MALQMADHWAIDDGIPAVNGGRLLNRDVLVLNQNFVPLNVCRVRRATLLLLRGKAEMVEQEDGHIRAAEMMFPMPSVIRLSTMVRRPVVQRRLTRREVFARDGYACQYCGKASRSLTLDHIMPRSRGGQNTWLNVISACVTCNHRKAGRTPEEAGMRLLRDPGPPPHNPYYPFYRYLSRRPTWRVFFPAGIADEIEADS